MINQAGTVAEYDLKSEVIVIAKDPWAKVAKILYNMNRNNLVKKEIQPVILRTLNEGIADLGKELKQRLSGKPEKVKLGKTFFDELNVFTRNAVGDNSKYRKVSNQLLTNIDRQTGETSISFDHYMQIYNIVNDLAEDNRVWWGQNEAIRLLAVMRNTACIDEASLFKGNEVIVLQEYARFIQSNDPTIVEEIAYEKVKSELLQKLDEAFESVRSGTAKALAEYGLTLERSQ